MKRLEGKVALVTGAGQGIGAAIALKLAEEGADVVIDDLKIDESAKEVKAQVEAMGQRAFTYAGDVSSVEDVRAMMKASVEALGGVDILVNNAGVEIHNDFWDVEEKEYDLVMDVNMKGAFFATQAFVRHCREVGKGGRVINISSVHEDLAFPHFTAYCASKGGMRMMCRNLAVELGPLGITVNNIAPGAIKTPINAELLEKPEKVKALLRQIPLGRLGETKDVTGMAAFLASEDAAYVTGSTFVVDGGLMVHYEEQ